MNPYQQPYFGRPAGYMYNPYQQPMPQMQQPMVQQQPIMQQSMQPMGLQGKSVDSIDVVKAMDIPLDGSVSYFPLVDGTAIITKQLQMDGTSKTIIYEPIKAQGEQQEQPKYLTADELNEQIKIISKDNNNLKTGMEDIKVQMQEVSNKFKELLDEMRVFRGGKR
jgi:hypothetical protein